MPRTLALAGVITLSLALAGCGDGEKTSEGASAVPASPSAEAPAAPSAATTTASASGPALQVAGLSGDPARGQKLFAQCRSCHVTEAGVNRVGPTLHGVVGRKAGSAPDYRYSAANENSAVVWTEQNLFEFLENPRKYLPGTKMAYPGMKDPQRRADLIAYLKTQG